MTTNIVTTDLQLANAKAPAGKRIDYKIKNHPGLSVRVSSRSKKFRSKVYCSKKKRRITITLGDATKGMMISEAAMKLAEIKTNGPTPKPSDQLTISDVLDDFYLAQVSKLKRPETVKDIFKRFIIPLLENTALNAVETYLLSQEVERIRAHNGEEPARKTLCYLSKLFKWCKATGRTKSNPTAELSGEIFKFEKAERDRHLSNEEVPVLFKAVKNSSIDVRSKIAINLLLRTGVRSGELLAAKWADVNLNTEIWLIPAENTKTNQSYSIPLSPQICDLFLQLKHVTEGSELVMGSISRLAITRALTRLQQSNKSGLRQLAMNSKLNVHDLRRSFVTFLNELGVAPHIVEKMVNHKLQGVMAIYNHAELLEERKAAICLLSDTIDSLAACEQEARDAKSA